MAHVRESIRNQITSTLTGLGTTGSNVFKTRFFPLAEAKLPAICIYSRSERSEYATITIPRTVLHEVDFTVEAYVKAKADVENTIDDISVEVSEALATDVTRGGLAKDTRVIDFSFDFNAEGEQPIGIATFTIVVDYVTLENNLEAAV
jgi:hypothetical protein|tara:strand:- start:99 stop:542 length:444 start_codon:yes stop_codon:yes gene_type:complete